jgi:hypothetical protein
MTMKVPGPAASLIDFGYAVKLPLSRAWDNTLGIRESDIFSLVRFLNLCYTVRRPGFVWVDRCAGWRSR